MDDDLIATAVTWLPTADEMPLDEVNEAIEWVIEEQHRERVLVPPVAHLSFPSYDACRYPGAQWDRHFKGYVGGKVKEFAIVVSDRPLSEEQTDEVLREHYRLQELPPEEEVVWRSPTGVQFADGHIEEVMQPEDVDQDHHGGDVGQLSTGGGGG